MILSYLYDCEKWHGSKIVLCSWFRNTYKSLSKAKCLILWTGCWTKANHRVEYKIVLSTTYIGIQEMMVYRMDSVKIDYKVYFKMAQNWCDRDRVRWLVIHWNFKMAQIFSLPFLTILRFELQNGPEPQNGPQLENGPNLKMAYFTDVENSKLYILVRSLRPFWSSNIKMAQNEEGKYLGYFEVWIHIKSRALISVTAFLSHLEVYLVLKWILTVN